MDDTSFGGCGKGAALASPTRTLIMVSLFLGVLNYDTKGPTLTENVILSFQVCIVRGKQTQTFKP